LTGQLRVITRNLLTQSSHYIEQAPRDYVSYYRDLGRFSKDLQMQVMSFDTIIQSLQARSITADLASIHTLLPDSATRPKVPTLTDPDETIKCTWDAPSRSQLDKTIAVWNQFHIGLKDTLGQDRDGPRLEAAAHYILLNEQTLTLSTAELASTFRQMMENKLLQIKRLNQSAIVIIILISITIMVIVYRRIFRPLGRTVAGFHRVAHGDLSHQVPVYVKNEIGVIADAFNNLTRRLSTLFRLTDRINQAHTLDDTLKFVFEEFPIFLPVHWVGVLRTDRNQRDYHLDRSFTTEALDLNERDLFEYRHSLFEKTMVSNRPMCTCIGLAGQTTGMKDGFMQRLQQNGLRSVLYLPLLSNQLETAALVIATHNPNAYNADHLEFISNIASQVSHSFEKTIGMESLVIATVKGLAKLAESRDPETGDHLFRMSHYAAMVAYELGKTDKYRELIDANYVRDILTFAPMHDIGKVGISDSILLKPGKLTDEEFTLMQQHPVIGGDVLRRCEEQMNAMGRCVFQVGIEIAEGHHEKYNGSGYPSGLKGNEIPLAARIVAVADIFDALTSKRPYKEAWPVDKAMAWLDAESGSHLDPDVLAAFKQAMPGVMDIYEKHKHV
ncbi:MAG: HD domain-containing phosphohydrolase, partial [Gammaproteobacteria bacterium]